MVPTANESSNLIVAGWLQRLAKIIKRRPVWLALCLFGLILLGVDAYQLTYPRDRALSGSKLGEQNVSGWDRSQIEFSLNNWFNGLEIELELEGKGQQLGKISELGAAINSAEVQRVFYEYPLVWRLLPGSLWWQRPKVDQVSLEFNRDHLKEILQKYKQEHDRAAVNAEVSLDQGRLVVANEQPGLEVLFDPTLAKITELRPSLKHSKIKVNVVNKTTSSKLSVADFQALERQVEQVSQRRLIVKLGDSQVQMIIPAEELLGWLELVRHQDAPPQLSLSAGKLDAYIDGLNQRYAEPGEGAIISIFDGQRTVRRVATDGQEINRVLFKEQAAEILQSGQSEVYMTAQFQPFTPPAKVEEGFSYSQVGLQAKLEQLARRYDVRIVVKQLDGNHWQAAVRENESIPSASTYKLFVAAKLFDEMKQGRLGWDSPWLDTNVTGCFERMIVVSTNRCAEEFIRRFGRQQIEDYVRGYGISAGTNFQHSVAIHTTAADLAKMVELIHSGKIVDSDNQRIMLDAMGRQKWRAGIPAGSKGRVQDKVGFLWSYVHDVGVVYHPQGTYILSVMTKNASYGVIAQITREIEQIMYP